MRAHAEHGRHDLHGRQVGLGTIWAVLNGARIRERFTSLDLGWAAGVLPDAAGEIVDQYLV